MMHGENKNVLNVEWMCRVYVKISSNSEICDRMLECKEMYKVYIHVYNEPSRKKTVFMVFKYRLEDQWSCKLSPEIWAMGPKLTLS